MNDTDVEGDETIIVRGTNATPAVITLVDDDRPTATLSSTTTAIAEDAGATTVTLNAALDRGPAANARLNLTFDGTATRGASGDYTVTPTTMSITAGATSASVSLTITPASTTRPTTATRPS